MPRTLVFDTSIASKNLGDEIIMEAVRVSLSEILPNNHLIYVPTHEAVGAETYALSRSSETRIVGGTNLLSSNILLYNQWKLGAIDALFIKNLILMGVGWWQYQSKPNLYTSLFYKRVLSKHALHSVRDGYTLRQLASAGIHNAVNTGCPTTWSLSPSHLENVPVQIGDKVVFTLTDYNQVPNLDGQLVELLLAKYSSVYFWPQGSRDLEYLHRLGLGGIKVLSPSVAALDALLASDESIDYVGTRLHAGIRALQFRRRVIVVAVDNRAREISKDIFLPIVERDQLDLLKRRLETRWETALKIDFEAISAWKASLTTQ